ncbi:hypothetical protein BaRGS_00006431 [Batillaria attramentaria]|uniref:Uncharacterized protein n=1 Tax=Batillaria attramentaria TaxID=370345 RepID=A0ABD0LSM1_9CAEN
MDRISSVPNLSLLEHSEGSVHTSLLDNWMYQSAPSLGMARSSTVPELLVEDVMLPFGIPRADINFNINEDDLDCPGQHGPRGLCFNSSSDTLYDSSEEDMEVRTRTRAMSVDDEAYLKLGDSDHEDDNNGNSATTASSVRFMLTPLPLEEELEDGDSPEETELDDTPNTPLGLEYSKTRSGSFFRLQRRASFDNGVFGMPDRIARGDLVVDVSERNALTAPATPADPSTPVGRFLSEEELALDPEQVFNRIYNRE